MGLEYLFESRQRSLRYFKPIHSQHNLMISLSNIEWNLISWKCELYSLGISRSLNETQICGRFSRGLSRDYVGLRGKVNNLKVCQLESLVHRQLRIYIWLSWRPTLYKIQSGSKLVWIVIGVSKTIWTIFKYNKYTLEK